MIRLRKASHKFTLNNFHTFTSAFRWNFYWPQNRPTILVIGIISLRFLSVLFAFYTKIDVPVTCISLETATRGLFVSFALVTFSRMRKIIAEFTFPSSAFSLPFRHLLSHKSTWNKWIDTDFHGNNRLSETVFLENEVYNKVYSLFGKLNRTREEKSEWERDGEGEKRTKMMIYRVRSGCGKWWLDLGVESWK